jgi:hypothetical protein
VYVHIYVLQLATYSGLDFLDCKIILHLRGFPFFSCSFCLATTVAAYAYIYSTYSINTLSHYSLVKSFHKVASEMHVPMTTMDELDFVKLCARRFVIAL